MRTPIPVSVRATSKVLAGSILGIFLAAIEGTVVGTVMPTVVGELGGLAKYHWAFTVYMVASAVTMPIWGKLADLHGPRRYFIGGVLLFVAGSALAGTSTTMDRFVAYRALQGLGAGAMFSLPMTILGHQTPPERRGHVMGFAAGTWGVAALLGPPVGALIVAAIGWRWVFYLNIPFGLAAIWLVARHFVDPERHRQHRLDIAGALLIMAWTLSLLMGVQAYREGAPILGLAAGTWGILVAVLFVAILVVERRSREPIVPLHLFRHRVYRVANAGAFLFAFCVFSAIVYVPMMATLLDPDDVARAGLSLVPASLGWTTGSLVGGRLLARTGARNLAVAGAFVSALGFTFATQLGPETPLWRIMPNMFPIGIGIGLSSPAILVTLQNRFSHHMGVVTSGVAFWRHLGGTLGITLLGLFVPPEGTRAIQDGVQQAFMAAAIILGLVYLLMFRLPKGVLPGDEEEAEHAALTGTGELGMAVERQGPDRT